MKKLPSVGRLLLFLALPLFGDSLRLDVKPSQIQDVQVVPPGSAEFDAAAAALIPNAETRAILQEALSRSILVKNVGTKPIVMFVVRYEFGNLHGVLAQDLRGQPTFQPGAFSIITPSNNLTGPLNMGGRDSALRAAASMPEARGLLRSADLRVSVDSALYADGTFAGPDVSGVGDQLDAERVTALSIAREIQSMGDVPIGAIRAHLKEREDAKARSSHTETDMNDLRAFRQASMHVTGLLQKYGPSALDNIFADPWLQAFYPQLKRIPQ